MKECEGGGDKHGRRAVEEQRVMSDDAPWPAAAHGGQGRAQGYDVGWEAEPGTSERGEEDVLGSRSQGAMPQRAASGREKVQRPSASAARCKRAGKGAEAVNFCSALQAGGKRGRDRPLLQRVWRRACWNAALRKKPYPTTATAFLLLRTYLPTYPVPHSPHAGRPSLRSAPQTPKQRSPPTHHPSRTNQCDTSEVHAATHLPLQARYLGALRPQLRLQVANLKLVDLQRRLELTHIERRNGALRAATVRG
eukprot:364237-Chlamydomonas_euryale.AAC.2